MTIDLDDLERKAKAATPGKWSWGEAEHALWGDGEYEAVIDSGRHRSHSGLKDNDAEFIAAASPAVVLELVAELRKLRGE